MLTHKFLSATCAFNIKTLCEALTENLLNNPLFPSSSSSKELFIPVDEQRCRLTARSLSRMIKEVYRKRFSFDFTEQPKQLKSSHIVYDAPTTSNLGFIKLLCAISEYNNLKLPERVKMPQKREEDTPVFITAEEAERVNQLVPPERQNAAISSLPLTSEGKKLFKKLEAIVNQNITRFLIVGWALKEIQNKRLYRQRYKTFEHYASRKFELSRQRLYQIVFSYDTFLALNNLNEDEISEDFDFERKDLVLLNERQCRELVPVKKISEESSLLRLNMMAVYEKAQEIAESRKRMLSAVCLRKAAEELKFREPSRKVKISIGAKIESLFSDIERYSSTLDDKTSELKLEDVLNHLVLKISEFCSKHKINSAKCYIEMLSDLLAPKEKAAEPDSDGTEKSISNGSPTNAKDPF